MRSEGLFDTRSRLNRGYRPGRCGPRAAQGAGITFLPSEWAVSVEAPRRAAFGTVGIVRAAGLYG